MRWVVDPRDPRPIYQQIAASVRTAIAEGSLSKGTRLPSAKLLAETLEVNLHTVLQAYQLLRAEGIIELRRGRGAVVLRASDESESLELAIAQLLAQAAEKGLSTQELVVLIQEQSHG